MNPEMTRRKRRTFSPEFKAEVVRRVRAGGSAHGVARELDAPYSQIAMWVKDANLREGRFGDEVPGEDKDQELQRLRKEVQRLRMEKEILKKAMAFFAKENE